MVTQTQINDAVLLAKSASYRLAYELVLEVKYGGKMECCLCTLKALWLYIHDLSCVEDLDATSVPPITEASNCMTETRVKLLIGQINSLVSKE